MLVILLGAMLVASCGSRQSSTTAGNAIVPALGGHRAEPGDSVYVVAEVSTGFGRPERMVSVEVAPDEVVQMILKQRKRRLGAFFGPDTVAMREALATGDRSVQRLQLNDSIDAYLLHLSDIGGESWTIWLRGRSGRLSRSPLEVAGSLATQPDDTSYGPGIRLPGATALAMEDIDGDGAPELLLSMRRHNGNVYDAIVTHYLRCDAALQLNEMLRVERWATLPMDTSGKRIRRAVMYDSKGSVFIVTTSLMTGSKASPIGTFMMSRDGQPAEQRPVPGTTYASLLITCHPEGTAFFFSFPPKL